MISWIKSLFKKKEKKREPLLVQPDRYSEQAATRKQYERLQRDHIYPSNPQTFTGRDSSNDFLEGALVGGMLGGAEGAMLGGMMGGVEGGIIGGEIASFDSSPSADSSPSSDDGGGGDFDGGGASGDF